MSQQTTSLFRKEAVTYHEQALGPGNLVRYSGWVRWGYWIALLAIGASVLALALVRSQPTLTVQVSPTHSPIVVTMAARSSAEPPIGAQVVVGGDVAEVVSVAPGSLAGTYSLSARLTRPWPTGTPLPKQAKLQLPAESLLVMMYHGIVGG